MSLSLPDCALSFPELIRKGYTSCVACHVSPNGGGSLTSYGRGVSAELASFDWEGAGAFAGIPWLESWRDPTGLFSEMIGDLQIDWRTVSLRVEREGSEPISKSIPMQLSVELVLHFGKTTDLVASYGEYGPNYSLESRVHYFQVRSSKYLGFRIGRFRPAFGINFDDHTIQTRALTGFGEGAETLGAEAHFESEIMSVTAARVIGSETVIADTGERWSFESERRESLVLRSTIKLGARHYLGASAYHEAGRDILAVFAASAPIRDWLYFLAEYDRVKTKIASQGISILRVGTEPLRGLTVNLDLKSVDELRSYSLGVQTLPIPHVELRLEARLEDEVKTYLLMSHLWL